MSGHTIVQIWGLPLGSFGDVYCIFVIVPCGILRQVWYMITVKPEKHLT